MVPNLRRTAVIFSSAALALAVVGWSAVAYRTARGRGPGSGDVAAGLAGTEDLALFILLGCCGVAGLVLACVARRREPRMVVVALAHSVSIATIVASVIFIAFPLLP